MLDCRHVMSTRLISKKKKSSTYQFFTALSEIDVKVSLSECLDFVSCIMKVAAMTEGVWDYASTEHGQAAFLQLAVRCVYIQSDGYYRSHMMCSRARTMRSRTDFRRLLWSVIPSDCVVISGQNSTKL